GSGQFTGVGRTPVLGDYTSTARDQVASITVSSLAAEDVAELHTNPQIFYVSLAGASATSWGNVPAGANTFWLEPMTGDFNGDGLSDVVFLDLSGKWWVGINNGAGGFTFSSTSWASWSTSVTWTVFVGDFNGDGKQDVAGFTNNFGGSGYAQWWVGLSDGSSTFTTTVWAAWSTAVHWAVMAGDYTGDGMTAVAGFVTVSTEPN